MKPVLFLGLAAVLGLMAVAEPAAAQSRNGDEASVRSSRPRVLIQPRRQRLSADARRECRARLVQEHRPSGTVIVPQMTCWWE